MNKQRRDNEREDIAFYTSGFLKILNLFLYTRRVPK